MPYKTFWERAGIVWKFDGHVTAEEIEQANDEFYSDERSDLARFQIIDAMRVTSVEWTPQDIVSAAALDIGSEHTLKGLRVAYVAADPDIMRLIENYADISRRLNSSWEFQGFDNLRDARDWVGA